ncbi:MAG: GNAT family N-acetyltransferase [Saprospiraceae bacterium]
MNKFSERAKMKFNIQPTLEDDNVLLLPLQENDFEEMYVVASDPKIWEQHPNKDRWKKEVFKVFFEGAILSKGAFKIVNKVDRKTIGCTRFYDYNESDNSIRIGYTFYSTDYWGKGINHRVKTLMLDYIFNWVFQVDFHIGANNIRSQIAIGRLGTNKVGEQKITYFGEQPKMNFIYRLLKEEWIQMDK